MTYMIYIWLTRETAPTGPIVFSLLLIIFILIIIWLPFLRRPYEIVLIDRQLMFKSPIRTIKMEVGDIISVKDGSDFIRFKSKKRSIRSISSIKKWDELIKTIESINPAVEVRRAESLRRVVSLAVLLVFADAFLLNQGVIAAITGIVLLVRLPRIFREEVVAVQRSRLRNWAIYMMAVVLVFVLNVANNRIAQRRADILISAVKAYHAKYQCYPESLKELVPEFTERIPRAKYTLIFNLFRYWKTGDSAILSYCVVPPYPHSYSFSINDWMLD